MKFKLEDFKPDTSILILIRGWEDNQGNLMIYSQRLLTKVRYATETEYEITVWISEANLQNEISRAEIAKISIGMIDGNLQMESSCACVNEDRVFGTRLKIADITFV